MCNQRDRLIAYIYNECDSGERDLVQRHLDTCDECRVEVAGLRSVREDLLAWDVPVHESVWRPFAPAPAMPWWRQVPAWAFATAAGVVMLSGAAGGAALHAFLPDRPVVLRAEAPVVTTTPTLTSADLTAAEQRWLAQLRDEVGAVDARVQKASNRSLSPRGVDGSHDALAAEVVELRAQNKELAGVIKSIWANRDQDLKNTQYKNAWLETKIKNLEALVLQVR